jgi:archaellum biogenesis ATPase FlaH
MTPTNKLDLDFFEYIVLDNCFKNEAYLASIIDFAKPSYFNNPEVRKVYGIFELFYQKRARIPSNDELKVYFAHPSIKLAFQNVQATLKNLGEYGEDELIENTEVFIKERGFSFVLEDLVARYDTLDIKNEALDILGKFDSVCNVSLNTELGMDFFHDIDGFADGLDKEDTYISTGFQWLDKKLGGGYKAAGKAIYVYSGATNAGKSIMLGNAAATMVKAGHNVVVVTLEMSEEIYATRTSAQLTLIPQGALREEKQTLKDYCYNHIENHDNRLMIKEFPNNSVKVSGIKNYINELKKRKNFKPDAIVVDYLNLIAPNNPTGQSYADVKGLAEDLRALSYFFHCPVITATQLGREAFNQENPGIETISESIGTAQTADVQISVFSTEEDRANGMINLGIQKNRYGENYGTKCLNIDFNTLHVEQFQDDLEDEDEGIDNFINDAESSLRSLEII